MSDEKACRICLSSDKIDEFISPCLCIGGSKYVHRSCLNNWRNAHIGDSYYKCEVCKYTYTYHRLKYGNLLKSNITINVFTAFAMVSGIFLSGQVSSRITNLLWYWFMYMDYHQPHRLQVLIHGLTVLGVPGLLYLLNDLVNAYMSNIIPYNNNYRNADRYPDRYNHNINSNINNNDRNSNSNPVPLTSIPSYYIINHNYNTENIDRTHTEINKESRKEDKECKENTTKKEKPIAKYTAPNIWLVLLLLVGVGKSYHLTYKLVHKYITNVCEGARNLVENIQYEPVDE